MLAISHKFSTLFWVLLTALATPLMAQDEVIDAAADPARQVHLLQYIAVDYSEAVAGGEVINAEEYAEMEEFAGIVMAELPRLPASPDLPGLQQEAARLAQLIALKSAPVSVAAQAETIRQGILQAYQVVPLPATAPDLQQGATLYAQQCATCHGPKGFGDGPAAAGLEPAPSNFHDDERTAQLDVLAYFNTIRYGVEGTSMASYAHLPEQQRWNLSFYLASLAASDDQRADGERLWSEAGGAEPFDSLSAVITTAPIQLNDSRQRDILAYLRVNPGIFTQGDNANINIARDLLAQSMERFRAGDAVGAQRLAVAAYLDGYELSESAIAARDGQLSVRLEGEMLAFRQLLREGADAEQTEAAYRSLLAGLDQAEAALSSDDGDPFWLAFIGALLVLLREGLEAILVVAAILAFVKRVAGGSTRMIHWGWGAALALGLVTWIVAVTLIDISGAAREITEGAAALLAAAVLFYMGFWLHDKSHAASWQQYLKRHMDGALSAGSRYGLGILAFIAVYREVFETILFLQAMWLQTSAGGHLGIISGGIVAAIALVILAIIVLRFSARLPISRFFAFSAVLMSVLAIVFAGKGILALQEAGWLPLHVVPFPRIEWLGIYPSLEGLLLQALMLVLLIYLLWFKGEKKVQPA